MATVLGTTLCWSERNLCNYLRMTSYKLLRLWHLYKFPSYFVLLFCFTLFRRRIECLFLLLYNYCCGLSRSVGSNQAESLLCNFPNRLIRITTPGSPVNSFVCVYNTTDTSGGKGKKKKEKRERERETRWYRSWKTNWKWFELCCIECPVREWKEEEKEKKRRKKKRGYNTKK